MKFESVRSRIVVGFSAVIVLMIGLCLFAYVQLRGIEAQAISLHVDSVPGLHVVSTIQALSISTYALTEMHILEREQARMEQIHSEIDLKTAEMLDSFKRY